MKKSCTMKNSGAVKLQRRDVSSSEHCSVPQCTSSAKYSNISFHSFPADDYIRKQWLDNIRRDQFTVTTSSKVCGRHFLAEDMEPATPRTLLSPTPAMLRRRLRRFAVPLLFHWNDYSISLRSIGGLSQVTLDHNYCAAPGPTAAEELKLRIAKLTTGLEDTTVRRTEFGLQRFAESDEDVLLYTSETPTTDRSAEGNADGACDHNYWAAPKPEQEELLRVVNMLTKELEEMILRSRFGLHRFAGSDEDIRFYTRFATYEHLMRFWSLIEPATTRIVRDTRSKELTPLEETKLAPIDELFLFLVHLSVGLQLRDLANRFNIPRTAAVRIIHTWANFLYTLLGSVGIWMSPAAVQAHLPAEFAKFPDTQVVITCTEIYCETPSSHILQSEVYSIHQAHPTFKCMLGMAPHGAITFVSALYTGSMSDREIFRQSGIVPLLTPDMAIMVDKDLLINELVPCKVHQPAFLSKRTQMPEGDVGEAPLDAHLTVHLERCMQRVKNHELFDTIIPLSITGIVTQLFSVACLLVNYQSGPLVKASSPQSALI